MIDSGLSAGQSNGPAPADLKRRCPDAFVNPRHSALDVMRIWTVVKYLIRVRSVVFLSANIADAIVRRRGLQGEMPLWRLG